MGAPPSWLSRLVRTARVEVALLDARHVLAESAARTLPQFTFNHTRTLVLRASGLSIGARSLVMGPLRLTGSANYRELFSIGVDTMITGPLHADLGERVTIGDRVHIGHQVTLLTIDHEIGPPEERCGPIVSRPITIADGVWIGSNVTVLPGATIGKGSVVAAGAVVTRSVPPNVLVGGVPAKVIRELEHPGQLRRAASGNPA